MTAVAKSYWRSVKRGTRTLAALPAEVQAAVRVLARQDLASGAVSAAQYEALLGKGAPDGGAEAEKEVTDNGGQ